MRRSKSPFPATFHGHDNAKTPGQRPDLGFTMEPPSGFEPETHALRARQSVSLGFTYTPHLARLCRSTAMHLAAPRSSFTGLHPPSGHTLATRQPVTRPTRAPPGRGARSVPGGKVSPAHRPSDAKRPYPAWGRASLAVYAGLLGRYAASCQILILLVRIFFSTILDGPQRQPFSRNAHIFERSRVSRQAGSLPSLAKR